MTPWRVMAVAAVMLMTTGCSGDSDDADTTTSNAAPTSTSVPTTTEASTMTSTTASHSTVSTAIATSSGSANETSVAPSTAATTVPSTEPPGTDTDAVMPVLQGLIDRLDAAVAAVLVDPRVARDPASPLVQSYVALFVPDSAFPATAVSGWQGEADLGRFYAPGPTGVLRQSTVVSVTASSADAVEFTVCIANSIVISDEAGAVLESRGGVDGGLVRANRVDGVWLLRDLSQMPPEGCPDPAAEP